MKNELEFAFISRHVPTSAQYELAEKAGIKLEHVGDMDAFMIKSDYVGMYDGVIVVHPAAALRLCQLYIVGVFENKNRAPEGEKPSFSAKALHLYDLRTTGMPSFLEGRGRSYYLDDD